MNLGKRDDPETVVALVVMNVPALDIDIFCIIQISVNLIL